MRQSGCPHGEPLLIAPYEVEKSVLPVADERLRDDLLAAYHLGEGKPKRGGGSIFPPLATQVWEITQSSHLGAECAVRIESHPHVVV